MWNAFSTTWQTVQPFEFILLCLITWRLSNLLVREEGPFDIFVHLRVILGVGLNEKGRCVAPALVGMLCCLWCTSIWVALIVCLVAEGAGGLILVLPVSAGAIMVDRWVR